MMLVPVVACLIASGAGVTQAADDDPISTLEAATRPSHSPKGLGVPQAVDSKGDVFVTNAPGDPITSITVPVLSPSGIGVSIAMDCDGNLYYTNYLSAFLYKMDATGALLDTKPLVDQDGRPITLGEMSWDDTRQVLWAGTDDRAPIQIYTIDPTSGVATHRFDGGPGISLTDGLAYEDTGSGVIWHSPDVSMDIYKFDAATGASLGSLTPLDAAGAPLGSISGVMIGLDPILYIGRNGFGEIVKVNKNTGAFIASFSTPGGRDEGLECDAVNFDPLLAVWSKDAFDNTVSAIELEPNTCLCGGVVPVENTSWGQIKNSYR
jgi:outer membrane protein assembly factor BamB